MRINGGDTWSVKRVETHNYGRSREHGVGSIAGRDLQIL